MPAGAYGDRGTQVSNKKQLPFCFGKADLINKPATWTRLFPWQGWSLEPNGALPSETQHQEPRPAPTGPSRWRSCALWLQPPLARPPALG